MLPEHIQPLEQNDLARLDRFLHTTACGQEAMGLSYAHGFLTAVASGPEQLEPSEWLRLMFDDPVFESSDSAQEMLGLALRLFQEIERGLAGEGIYRPVFEYVRDVTGDVHADAQRWCLGFVSGFGLFSELWTREARAILHTPLNLIFELSKSPAQPGSVYIQLCNALPEAAGAVFRYWQTDRQN